MSSFTVISDRLIHATTAAIIPAPTALTAYPIFVTALGGTNATSAGQFYYVPAPSASITPTTGPLGAGTPVTITGANFVPGATSLTFGGAPTDMQTITDTTITALAPGSGAAGPVTVVVTTPGGSANMTYTYRLPPTVTSLSPKYGLQAGGNSVNINGNNFYASSGYPLVQFGSTSATNIVTTSQQLITVTVPAGTGVTDVSVQNVIGTGTLSNAYTYATAPSAVSTLRINANYYGTEQGARWDNLRSDQLGGAPLLYYTVIWHQYNNGVDRGVVQNVNQIGTYNTCNGSIDNANPSFGYHMTVTVSATNAANLTGPEVTVFL